MIDQQLVRDAINAAFDVRDVLFRLGLTCGFSPPMRRIECATARLAESIQYLVDRFPAAMRVKHARRVRRAVREIMTQIERLDALPGLEVAEALGMLEAIAEHHIRTLADEARAQPLN